jgi:hypothetical protein
VIFIFYETIPMLKRREECDTYLTHICRLMKATVLAESSLFFILSPGSLCSSDVYRCE